jgi:hypothetical protein
MVTGVLCRIQSFSTGMISRNFFWLKQLLVKMAVYSAFFLQVIFSPTGQ